MSPRQVWKAILRVLPSNAIISTDIGNACAISNAYPSHKETRMYMAPKF